MSFVARDFTKNIMRVLMFAIAFCVLLYVIYWLTKYGAYWLWYEDMVKETVIDMVKQSALKGHIP